MTRILALLVIIAMGGCASSPRYPDPHNPYYHRGHDGLWYCFGSEAGKALPRHWYDDPCRIDVCALNMPRIPECVPFN